MRASPPARLALVPDPTLPPTSSPSAARRAFTRGSTSTGRSSTSRKNGTRSITASRRTRPISSCATTYTTGRRASSSTSSRPPRKRSNGLFRWGWCVRSGRRPMRQPDHRDQQHEQQGRYIEHIERGHRERLLIDERVAEAVSLVDREPARLQRRERAGRVGVVAGQMLGELGMVQARTVTPKCCYDRRRERSGGDAHEVVQAGPCGDLLGLQIREGDTNERNEETGDRRTLNDRRKDDRGEIGLRIESATHHRDDREDHHRSCRQEARIDALCIPAYERREQDS